MATTTYYLKGKARWAKIFPHFMDTSEDFHGPGGAYTIDILVEKEELDIFNSTGSRIRPKLTDDGVVLKFKRKHSHPSIEALGGPPQVVDAEKNPWDGALLGDDTEVEVAISVYDTKLGKGTRLEGVRVLDFIPIPGREDGEEFVPTKKLPF